MDKEYFKSLLEQINIDLDENKIEQFSIFKNKLLEWCEKTNLTTITDI